MSNPPAAPLLAPFRIAEETYVIPQVAALPVGYVFINSLVITGQEPILVDTGTVLNRERWLEQVWSLVEPKDVRWIFLSHDDHDHTGNLLQVLDACPNARLVTNWFSIERLSGDFQLPLERCLWVNDGDRFVAGDRTFAAVRPPFFDSPTTRGLFDPKTGVYWAADCFGALVPAPVEDAAEAPQAAYREGFLASNQLISPWHHWLDEAKFAAHVRRVQDLPIRTIATAHGPAIHGPMMDQAFAYIREVPSLEPWPEPTQRDLEAALAMMAAPAPAAA